MPVSAVTLLACARRVSGHRLSVLVYQETPEVWVARAIEHDLTAEGRSIGQAVRGLLRMVQAHAALDTQHDRAPLAAFRPAAQPYWNAFSAGTPVTLEELDALPPAQWGVSVAIARSRPADSRSSGAPRAGT